MTRTSSKKSKSRPSPGSKDSIKARSANARAAREQRVRESGEKPPPNVFRRAFVGLVGVLVLLSVVFLLIGSSQGPKLADAQLDGSSVVSRPDQQLRLFLNQPVQDASTARASVTPETPATVTSNAEVVSVQFERPLFYNTDYSVRVDDIRGLDRRASSSIEHSFTTGSPTLMYLDRGEETDEIVRTGLKGSEREIVYTAKNIISFAVTGQALVVARAADDGSSILQLVSLVDGAVEEIRLPEPGVISKLSAADVGSVIGFTYTPVTLADDALGGSRVFVMDLELGRDLVTVGDLGDGPLLATDWRFMPNATSVIILGMEGNAFTIDSEPGSIPLPVGRLTTLTGVSQDGATVIGEDATGVVLTDLADGAQRDLAPSLVDGAQPYVGEVAIAWNGDIVEKTALQTVSGEFIIAVAVDDGTTGRSVYQPPGIGDSIDSFRLSPNGQYVAIEMIPDGTAETRDTNPTNPRSTATTTIVVELATGIASRSFEGFNLVWLPPAS